MGNAASKTQRVMAANNNQQAATHQGPRTPIQQSPVAPTPRAASPEADIEVHDFMPDVEMQDFMPAYLRDYDSTESPEIDAVSPSVDEAPFYDATEETDEAFHDAAEEALHEGVDEPPHEAAEEALHEGVDEALHEGVDEAGDAFEDFPPFPYYLSNTEIAVEAISNYVPGGFHPVKLGDCLGGGGRFRVLHKLGQGGNGVVWLCRDKLSGELRAVKINAAMISNPDNSEFRMAKIFQKYTSEEQLFCGISVPSEFFWLDGPNGRHLCSVSPFLGPNLVSITNVYGFCPQLLKDICFRLALAMRFIHRQGVCHGDFRPDNIVFQLVPGVEKWTDAEVYANLGEPELVKVIKTTDGEFDAGVPEDLVARVRFHLGNGFCSTRTAVVDFGVAYKVDEAPSSSGIPAPYAPPEDIFNTGNLGLASDLWSLACTLAQLRTGQIPFGDEGDILDQTYHMERVLGPLPPFYRASYLEDYEGTFANDPEDVSLPVSMTVEQWNDELQQNQATCGNSNYLLVMMAAYPIITNITPETQAKLEAHNHRRTEVLPPYEYSEAEPRDDNWDSVLRGPMDKEEADKFFDLLNSIFTWRPEDRPSIDQIIKHPWFEGRRVLLDAKISGHKVASGKDYAFLP
ncbi:kinase-like domain-containing protein [Podospora conica]|nr:kinase-like domain-containing protein [Schizothecium conicum]